MANYAVKQNQNLRGFTLIELLTVIAVIAILAAILIPSAKKVRTNAHRAESASNLRQTYAACALYSNDNNLRLLNSWSGANEEEGRPQRKTRMMRIRIRSMIRSRRRKTTGRRRIRRRSRRRRPPPPLHHHHQHDSSSKQQHQQQKHKTNK